MQAAFTDALTFHYVVAKYFEIPATGALLVADGAVREPLDQLGLIAHEHYLPVDAGNLEEVIESLFDPARSQDLDAIRQRGQELVLTAHKTSDRAARIDQVVACR